MKTAALQARHHNSARTFVQDANYFLEMALVCEECLQFPRFHEPLAKLLEKQITTLHLISSDLVSLARLHKEIADEYQKLEIASETSSEANKEEVPDVAT